jgi:hypothetical protein
LGAGQESRLPLAVHLDGTLSKSAFFLLSWLSLTTYPKGSAKVKIASLSQVTRNGERETRRQVKELVGLGYITVERLDSTTYVYKLTGKALRRIPKRPEVAKHAIGDCEVCPRKGVKVAADGMCFVCIRLEGKKRAYAEVKGLHPEWTKDQVLAELILQSKRRSYARPVKELEHEERAERRLNDRFAEPDDHEVAG